MVLSIFLVLTITISNVLAGQFLTGEKLKSTIIGKTFYAKHLKKGFEFKVYFDVDGQTAYRTTNSGVSKTTYKFDGETHCIYWKGVDRCAKILDNGDGSYIRVSNGVHMVSWFKVVQGKDL